MKLLRTFAIFMLLFIFMMSSYNKITNFNNTLISIEEKGLPLPLFALLGAISFQFLGISGILIDEFNLINSKILKYSKYFLVVFTILATYYYHNIFTMKNQQINFMKNLSIIGGLLLI